MAKRKETKTKEEKEAHQKLLQSGMDYFTISSIGDTSNIIRQASALEQYAISQGLDPEKDLNGLPRQVGTFSQLIPKEQESAKERLLETTEKHFNYALRGLKAEKAVGLAALIGTTEEELKLQEELSNPETKIENIKNTFLNLYEQPSLIEHYISLATPDEVKNSATYALERTNRRRALEFTYTKDNKIIYKGKEAKNYILENLDKANEKIAENVRLLIGSNLASIVIERKRENHNQNPNPKKP